MTNRNKTAKRPALDEESPLPLSDERQQREERILDTAAALLIRWGYRKTTIDDVAREAGVGKGTIYLHWPDKNKLFSAVIARASRQASEDMMRRVAADPDGGLFHRAWTHGLLAVFANPLMAALMRGRTDIFQGLMDTLDHKTLNLLAGNAESHIAQLQQAGLVRTDLPAPVVAFLMGSLKTGIIYLSDLADQEHQPSVEQLTDAISDLVRRWLEPDRLPGDSTEGKEIMGDWLKQANEIGESA